MRRALAMAFMGIVVLTSAAGCGTARDVSTPAKALLGHWRNTVPGTGADVYYGPSELTHAGISVVSSTVGYDIVSEDEKEFTLEIRAGSGGTSGISFSADRDSMTVAPARVPELLRYEYVDANQKP